MSIHKLDEWSITNCTSHLHITHLTRIHYHKTTWTSADSMIWSRHLTMRSRSSRTGLASEPSTCWNAPVRVRKPHIQLSISATASRICQMWCIIIMYYYIFKIIPSNMTYHIQCVRVWKPHTQPCPHTQQSMTATACSIDKYYICLCSIDSTVSSIVILSGELSSEERWGSGVETQKNVRGEIGGWGRIPFNEPYAPLLSTIYDGA